MSAATIHKAGLLTGRQMVLLVVVGLHALVIGGLMTMKIAIDNARPPAVFKPVTAIEPVEPLPPPPRLQVTPSVAIPAWTPPTVVPPLITIDVIPRAPAESAPVLVPEAPVGPVAEHPVDAVPATALTYRATRSPDDYYPAISLRLQEQGDAVVRVCVGPTGRREGSPVVERSSGSRHLDAAAVKWASEALAFTPATRNGAAVSACKGFRVNFTLK